MIREVLRMGDPRLLRDNLGESSELSLVRRGWKLRDVAALPSTPNCLAKRLLRRHHPGSDRNVAECDL